MNITAAGVTNFDEAYRGFTICWQEPPQTSAGWSGNVTSESRHLFALMGRPNAKVIRGRSRDQMLTEARAYVDTLLEGAAARPDAQPSVRDLFLEALAKKTRDVPPQAIRDYLIDRALDIGYTSLDEVGTRGGVYELTFRTGEKISFDGNDYIFTRP